MQATLKSTTEKRIGRGISRDPISHIETQEHIVAFTFDDGPHPEYTPRLLDILEKHKARATFFMVGEAAEKYPEIVIRVTEQGHAIGNHTWDHTSLPSVPPTERVRQIELCQTIIGPSMQRIFRPPYGDQTLASHLDVTRMGYEIITWNVSAEDWLDHDVIWMVNHILDEVEPGSIVLLHDALYRNRLPKSQQPYCDRQKMLSAVEMVLERLEGQFQLVTVPELLRHGTPVHQDTTMADKNHLSWLCKLRQSISQIVNIVRTDEMFILVDGNQWGTGNDVCGRRRIPFIELNGEYYGPPADDAVAIRELERLRESGANFIVFAWPAFWWLDYYVGLRDFLQTNFNCVLRNSRIVAFDLRTGYQTASKQAHTT